jgi:hypothetical protein
MQELINSISALYKSWSGREPKSIDVIPQSGSDRRYFRLHNPHSGTVIATVGINIPGKRNVFFFIFPTCFMQRIAGAAGAGYQRRQNKPTCKQGCGLHLAAGCAGKPGIYGRNVQLFRESLHQLARLQVEGDKT